MKLYEDKIDVILKKLFKKRGVEGDEEIEEFLSLSPKKTYDPFLMKNMDEAVTVILEEAAKVSGICIYGDNDADGVTTTTLMINVLSYITKPGQVDYYIPSRFEEGYGLNIEAINQIHQKGFDMILTVDCGSVSYTEVEHAKSLGMKVIVTDHHNITDTIADCILVNPKQPGCTYPFKELAGCGVAFKVAQGIQQRAGLPKGVLNEVLDLVAIGTIGDIMPLLDENRTMVKFGMKMINMGRRAGLAHLIDGVSLVRGKIVSENISFVIVPHLNASGRMEDASMAVELLRYLKEPETDAELKRLQEHVAELVFQNSQRKKVQQETFKLCVEQLKRETPEIQDFIVIKSEDAHEGIAGIVAGKIKETYYRPTIIVTPSGEEKQYLKGTGRSIEGVNLYDLLKRKEELFEKFGGHGGACGFLMREENLPQLREGLLEGMAELKEANEELLQRKYDVDMIVRAEDMTMDLAEMLELLAPFGNKNPRPLFLCENVTAEDVRFMGDENQHVRFQARSPFGKRIQCVLFNDAQRYAAILAGHRTISLVGTLECQVWQGNKKLQMLISNVQEM